MIYDGVITKPPIEEIIEHGWLQNASKKAHKYIDKYLKNGKWIYRYKSKAQELGAKIKRGKVGRENPEYITSNGKMYYNKYTDNGVGPQNDRYRTTYDRNWTWTFNKTKTTKVKVPKSKNMRDRGYSSSQGSGESKRQRNLGTRNVAGSNRYGTTVRVKNPKNKPQFESLSGSGNDGYTYTEPGWYWRGKSLENVSKRQDRNAVKVETYTVPYVKKIKTKKLYTKPITVKKI